ncbi:MAG: class I SAM-dependent methyltransferase [Euryarchaeota archaeon]|nr:class I SAM-dependent methyltransferase [Euryarchaeota archaeon]MCG2738250.1 class I SAM-dependent methyltransferase [Candidatus Methanoperedenaceae archaeon]
MAHKFDAQKADILDSADRRKFLNPDSILKKAGLDSDTVLADLGCGSGYFTIPASLIVKKVYAIDVQQEMLDILSEKIRKGKLKNIETILSKEASIPLPDNSVDVLFMANVFHELEDRDAILNEAKRILSGSGRLIIIDWKKVEMEMGPPVGERLAADEVVSICGGGGFTMLEKLEAGAYNYMLVFGKSAR